MGTVNNSNNNLLYIKQRCLSVSTHQLSMVDLRAKPMAYLESAGFCGCFSLVLND